MLPNHFKDALSYLEHLVDGKRVFYETILEEHWIRGWLSLTTASEYEAAVRSEWFDPHAEDDCFICRDDEEFDATTQMERSFRAGKEAARDWVEYINSLHGKGIVG